MTHNDRAIDMRNRALELVKARGTPTDDMTREYTNVGLTIHHINMGNTHRLTVSTKSGTVLNVGWELGGSLRVATYVPGLWETRLKHVTQRRKP
jgi:hypothetical protein